MNPVCLSRLQLVTAFGDSLDPLWRGVMAGQRALTAVDRFGTDAYLTDRAALIPGLTAVDGASRQEALLDRLLANLGPLPPGTELLTATTKGAIDGLERQRRGQPFPPEQLPLAQLGAAVARRTGCTPGPNVSAACASSTIALARAAERIARGAAEAVLVVGLDLVSEFVFSGFSALQALSPQPSRPFDRDRSGLTLGEGAAALLLVSEDAARRWNLPVLARLSGWGVAGDATHITAPARDGRGLVAAVTSALQRAGIAPAEIGAISAHGTGTVYNDAMELTAFGRVFDGRIPPLQSVKGAIGHTLGAAGAIEAALAVPMLQQRCLPPTVGLETPAEGGEGCLSAAAQDFAPGAALLSTNSGFGGINAALVLTRGDDR